MFIGNTRGMLYVGAYFVRILVNNDHCLAVYQCNPWGRRKLNVEGKG